MIIATLFILIIADSFSQASFETKKEMFKLAVLNKSTAPSYLVLTVTDKKSKYRKEIATTSNQLRGAIKKEYALNGNDAKIDKIILNNDLMVFEFTNKEALNNLHPDLYRVDEFIAYKNSINIDSIRKAIERNPAINKKLRKTNGGWMFDFTNEAHDFSDRKTQLMFAHVLFNNGIRTYQGDAVGNMVFYHDY